GRSSERGPRQDRGFDRGEDRGRRTEGGYGRSAERGPRQDRGFDRGEDRGRRTAGGFDRSDDRGRSDRGRDGGERGQRPSFDRGTGRGPGSRFPSEARAPRSEQPRHPAPPIPEDGVPQMLDRAARARLRTLTKANSDWVAEHLVMAGRMIDVDPERAYEHATAAVRRAGRVDVVREAVALTAYATGRYAEALREVRTVRRLSGIDAHPAIEADCERGLGRPEKALAVVAEAKSRQLSMADAVEVTLVESGARADLGEHEAALLVVEKLLPSVREPELRQRLLLVRADRLEALGRHDEAAAQRADAGGIEPEPESVVVIDLAGDDDGDAEPNVPHDPGPQPEPEAGPEAE